MLGWIESLDRGLMGLDIGCGKLRYTVPLSKRLTGVTAIDSKEQVDRIQTVYGERTSIREYASRSLPNVHVCAVEEESWKKKRYGVILCSNVLSAIPSRNVRRQVVDSAFSRLNNGGTFLLTTQFKNTHFRNWANDSDAVRYCDGYLVTRGRATSFYALLDSSMLVRLCERAGFRISMAGHAKELAYVFATR